MKAIIQESVGWRRSSTIGLTEKGIFLILYKDGKHEKGILITKHDNDTISITVPAFNPMKTSPILDLQLEVVEGVKDK